MTAVPHDPFRGAAPRRAADAQDAPPAVDDDRPDGAIPPPPAVPGSPGQPDLPGGPPGGPGPDPEPPAGEQTDDQPDVSGPPTGDALLPDGEHHAADLTITAWLDWVGDDTDRARQLHNAESARGADARTTLLDKLDHLLAE